MRICLVNLDYAPQRSSGLGVYGETLVNGLVAQGHEVHVVARGQAQPDGREVRGGAVVHRVPGGGWTGSPLRARPGRCSGARPAASLSYHAFC